MRIVLISDTHSLHSLMQHDVESFIDPKQYNILIHAGDCTNVGKKNEVEDFVYWYMGLKGFDTKIFIAGNHDLSFEEEPNWLSNYINDENLSQSNCVYLEDEGFVIELPEFTKSIKFYGSPWQPEFYNWAFNLPRNGKVLESKWADIPVDTDILITHGPPFGVLDIAPTNVRVGCELLYNRVTELNPLLHIFGHIHQSHGILKINNTLFVNASICTERYVPSYKPIVLDMKEIDGKINIDVL
jgi:Icc-related predicted phosphoesterase